jgi:hypothetical protein
METCAEQAHSVDIFTHTDRQEIAVPQPRSRESTANLIVPPCLESEAKWHGCNNFDTGPTILCDSCTADRLACRDGVSTNKHRAGLYVDLTVPADVSHTRRHRKSHYKQTKRSTQAREHVIAVNVGIIAAECLQPTCNASPWRTPPVFALSPRA